MKILHVVEPFSSGITTFITYLVNGMSSDENIVLHGSRVSSDELEKVKGRFNEGTKFVLWKNAVRPIHPLNDFLALVQLVKTIKNQKPDIIHLHSSKAGFIGRIASILVRRPIFYTPNGLSFARKDISTLTRKLYVALEVIANWFGGKIICCSESEKSLLDSVGIKSNFVNNGTIISKSTGQNNLADDTIITIGCLALITEQKDPNLFNTIARNFEHNDKVKFLWIGDGHLRSELNSKNIEITGWLSAEKKESRFNEIDIYLSCSLWEGLPFSVLEAMNNAKCLLLRNCVGNVDLVVNGTNGFLFQTGQEAIQLIEKLLTDKAKILEYGMSSFDILKEKFDVNQMVEKYKSIYMNSYIFI